jgi:hypothetical protein
MIGSLFLPEWFLGDAPPPVDPSDEYGQPDIQQAEQSILLREAWANPSSNLNIHYSGYSNLGLPRVWRIPLTC